MRIAFLLSFFWLAFPAGVFAQQLLETSGDWRVYSTEKDGRKLCYIASVPSSKTGNYSSRGEPFLMVTGRSASVDEVSLSSGYGYKQDSEVTATIGKERFSLFTQGDRAWAYDTAQDNRMIAAMAKGNEMTVRGTSQRGTFSSDGYSLKGFSKAHQRMKALCR